MWPVTAEQDTDRDEGAGDESTAAHRRGNPFFPAASGSPGGKRGGIQPSKPAGSFFVWLVVVAFILSGVSLGILITKGGGLIGSPVPDVRGLTQDKAVAKLRLEDFTPGKITSKEVSPDRPTGVVLAQDPSPGTKASARSKVDLTVSKVAALVTLPDVVGLFYPDALKVLETAGVKTQPIYITSGTVPRGNVIGQEPAGGVKVKKGATVRVIISLGRQTGTTVPTP
jgi:beta-lactam-binding protein with PASTA domain